MKTTRIIITLLFACLSAVAHAQEMPQKIADAIKNDDAASLSAQVTTDNVNTCYGYYSMLSQAVRFNARKCFDLLIERGADVNKSCNGYVPPLMHAVKYGHIDMVKFLVAKGANINYKYEGDLKTTNGPQKGDTPLIYAERYERNEIRDYLHSISNK